MGNRGRGKTEKMQVPPQGFGHTPLTCDCSRVRCTDVSTHNRFLVQGGRLGTHEHGGLFHLVLWGRLLC